MKQQTGLVIGKKMANTAKVLVKRIKIHPLYKKQMRIKKIYHVHDEMGAKIGEMVKFQNCRPISKTKKWKITEIIGIQKELKVEKGRKK